MTTRPPSEIPAETATYHAEAVPVLRAELKMALALLHITESALRAGDRMSDSFMESLRKFLTKHGLTVPLV
jgi:hypothetical protein